MENINAEFFKTRYPSVYSEIFKIGRGLGRDIGFNKGYDQGYDEGVAAREAQEKAFEEDFKNYKASNTGQSNRPLSFEEQIIFDWKTNESLRKEFVGFTSYEAFKRAEKGGRVRVYRR